MPSLFGSFLTELHLHYIYTHRDSLKFKFNVLGNFHSFVLLLYSTNILQQKLFSKNLEACLELLASSDLLLSTAFISTASA